MKLLGPEVERVLVVLPVVEQPLLEPLQVGAGHVLGMRGRRPRPLVQRGDANELAGQLHDAVRGLGPNTLSLAFIDPPGTQFRFESIRRLSEGLPMDLLINFPLGMNINRQHSYRRAADDETFDAYFGTPHWRDAHDGPEFLALY